jgi:hypothetical protein
MKLDLNALDVQSFSVEATGSTSVTTPPGTGPEGPNSLCWICYDTNVGVPGCDPKPVPAPTPKPYDPFNPYQSLVVDSRCMCYA